MDERLKKITKSFILEKPFKKTNEDKLFEKVKEFEKRLKVLEKELKETRQENERLNNFIRRFLPAFPSQIKSVNDEYILGRIKNELTKTKIKKSQKNENK